MIDVSLLFQNKNKITAYYPHKSEFYKEIYNNSLINIECLFLEMCGSFFSFFNFDNEKMTKNIFQYFYNNIINKKYEVLGENEYSFHCSLYRCFSIFLNRYCFYYINTINSQDINDGFKNAIKLIPDFKKFGNIIIKDMFKLFGFINACGENILNYYGERISFYKKKYYFYDYYILGDFALIRFLLSDKLFQSSLSIINIFKKLSIEDTYSMMQKYFCFPSFDEIQSEDNSTLEFAENYNYFKFSVNNPLIFKHFGMEDSFNYMQKYLSSSEKIKMKFKKM